MSAPNTQYMAERDELPLPPVEAAPAKPALPAGVQLEVDRIDTEFDDAVIRWSRERASMNDADLASLEKHFLSLEALCAHARKTVTGLRVLKRKASPPKE